MVFDEKKEEQKDGKKTFRMIKDFELHNVSLVKNGPPGCEIQAAGTIEEEVKLKVVTKLCPQCKKDTYIVSEVGNDCHNVECFYGGN